jgi:hypothetical protein
MIAAGGACRPRPRHPERIHAMTACHRMPVILLGLALLPAQAADRQDTASGGAPAPVPSAEMLEFLADWPDFEAETFDAMVRYGRRDARARGTGGTPRTEREGEPDD